MNYNIPQFESKSELFEHLKANKSIIIDSKKNAIKEADSWSGYVRDEVTGEVDKSFSTSKDIAKDTILARLVINTTKIMDSHDDVHLDNLWKKSLLETKNIYHLQEHKQRFDSVISDNVKAYTKTMTWKSLGFDYNGTTQALVFDSIITKDRNEFMYNQYLKGYVKNHSVGMRYVKIEMAINSDEKYYREEKATWDKYYSQIANKDVADERGYFFAVIEAKIIEGSAVPFGSNHVTPTLSITEAADSTSDKTEPLDSTRIDFGKLAKARILTNVKI